MGAHDWIGNLVQNGTIDPIQIPETVSSTLQPLAIEAVTFDGQTYGMPYTMNNIVLFRNTDLAPDAPATMEEMVAAGQEGGAGRRRRGAAGLAGERHRQPLLHQPALHLGRRLHVRPDRRRQLRPDRPRRRHAGLGRGVREDRRARREGPGRPQALGQHRQRDRPVHRRQDAVPDRGPVAADHPRRQRHQLRGLRGARVRGHGPGLAVHHRRRGVRRQRGRQQDARPGVRHQLLVAGRRRRPALRGDQERAGQHRHAQPDRGRQPGRRRGRPRPARRTARSCRASRRWRRSGTRWARPRRP